MWLNVGCGQHRAPAPWWNVDVVDRDGIRPDEVVEPGRLPYRANSVERLYLGHVLEHIEWEALPRYMAELKRVLEPGAPVLAVGPDVERAIRRWHDRQDSWSVMRGTLEGETWAGGDWAQARHRWNCTEARLAGLLERAGFVEVAAAQLEPGLLREGWPIVSLAAWQCAVTACAPARTRRVRGGRR